MTRTQSASANHPATSHAAARASPPAANPPRQQAESSAARDRFAARLERSEPRDSAIAERDEGKTPDDARTRVQRDPSEGSDRAASGQDGGDDSHADLAFAQSPTAVLQGASGVTGVAASPAALPIDPAMLERMAAQIAEQWPGAIVEAARIQFPDGMIVKAALLVREPDGSMAIRLTGLDPRVSTVQTARLQHDLANALARRRLRVGSLQFENPARVQRGSMRPGAGAASAIDRVV